MKKTKTFAKKTKKQPPKMALSKGPGTVIGLEVHVQLDTKSKLFCGCTTKGVEPNTATCEICLGFPGSKPMLNRAAVHMAVKTALALNCKLNRSFFFSRKTYFYPDLAKNFQTTQFESPVGVGGFVQLPGLRVELQRVHLEEDPAALVHEGSVSQSQFSLVDYNRSGIPLVEIVTAPCMSSPGQARDFLNALLVTLEYIGVFDQKNSTLKVDANISLEGGERVEIKNILGFRSVEKALLSEEKRQLAAFSKKEKIVRETRGFDEKTQGTFSLRKKETDEDYGYIFDPDLPIVVLDEKLVELLRSSIPELFSQKAERFSKKLGLSDYDAKVIASNPALSALFEQVILRVSVPVAARFFSRELLAIVNYNNLSLKGLNLSASEIAGLLEMLEKGTVSEKNAKEAMIKYAVEGLPPKEFLEKNGLLMDLKGSDAEKIVEEILKENPQAVLDLKKGEKKALNFLLGLVMRKSKGKTSAKEAQKLIEEKILHRKN